MASLTTFSPPLNPTYKIRDLLFKHCQEKGHFDRALRTWRPWTNLCEVMFRNMKIKAPSKLSAAILFIDYMTDRYTNYGISWWEIEYSVIYSPDRPASEDCITQAKEEIYSLVFSDEIDGCSVSPEFALVEVKKEDAVTLTFSPTVKAASNDSGK